MTQIKRSPSYLIQNPYSYCFRMTVPRDIQPVLGKKELRYSLKTGYLSEAKIKSRLLAGQTQLIFQKIRVGDSDLMELSKTDIQELIKTFFKRIIDNYDRPKPSWLENAMGYAGKYPTSSIHSKDELGETIKSFDEVKADLTNKLNSGDYNFAERRVDKLLIEAGFYEEHEEGFYDVNIDKSSSEYSQLCAGIYRAMIKGIEYKQKQLSGDYTDELENLFESVLDRSNESEINKFGYLVLRNNEPVQEVEKGGHTHEEHKSKSTSAVIELFLNENKVKWNPKTNSEVIASLNLFIEAMGDRPIQSLTRLKISEYKNILTKLPPNSKKTKEYRDKTISQILKMDVGKTLSPTRINKHLQRVGALLDYACRHGYYEGPNPATKLQVPESKKAKDKRAPYTNEELERLFQSEQYKNDTFTRSYMFWTPIIALFHGMRQGEIAGLFLDDIKKTDDGVWVFDLTEKDLKTGAASRVVPIHAFLLEELNFIVYVDHLKKAGEKQLFPELTKKRDGYGKNVGRWFNDGYKQKCGIVSTDGRKRDFHSCRTTFITSLRHKRVNDRYLKEVVGHSVAKDVTDRYTETYPAKQTLKEVISKVDFH
ncbi:MAG: site-specific integrase, partial [Desulfobacterales bacterium]